MVFGQIWNGLQPILRNEVTMQLRRLWYWGNCEADETIIEGDCDNEEIWDWEDCEDYEHFGYLDTAEITVKLRKQWNLGESETDETEGLRRLRQKPTKETLETMEFV